MAERDPAYADLIGTLDSLKTTVRKAALRKSLGKMGNLIKNAIQAKTPVQAGVERGDLKPGELKADLHVQIKIANDLDAATKSDKVAVFFGPNTEYVARFVEYGHENKRGPKRKGAQTTHGFTPAHPFIRPAFDATKDPAIELFEETMAEEIAKAMNG